MGSPRSGTIRGRGAGFAVKKVLLVPERILEWGTGASLLDRTDLRVRASRCGTDALEVAEAWRPDLVLVSNVLDDMQVDRFCRAVRRRVEDARLLLLTQVLENNTDGIRPDAHLLEPFDESDLLETVASLLNIGVRMNVRVEVEILAKVSGLGAEKALVVNLLNLSESGALVEASEVLTSGEAGDLEFYLPGDGKPLRISCIVRSNVDDLQLHYGVEFFAVDESTGDRIRQFIRARTGVSDV